MNVITELPLFSLDPEAVSGFVDCHSDKVITAHQLGVSTADGAPLTNLLSLTNNDSRLGTSKAMVEHIVEKYGSLKSDDGNTTKPITFANVQNTWKEMESKRTSARFRADIIDIDAANACTTGRDRNEEEKAKHANTKDTTNAFAIHNLLTPVECEYVIATAEPHMAPLDHLYAQKTRKADRAMIKSSVVAGQLYRRILPLLDKEKDYANRSPLCFGHDGVWVPLGLNECLKVFRYTPGGMFVPHRDGPWVPRQDQCSMYTVVVYLNDDFVGGNTLLAGSGDYCGPQGKRHYNWQRQSLMHMVPIQGSALVFNHDCWHAGHPVTSGTKWILRTELIFQRVHTFYVDKNAFVSEERYREARALYDASMAASAVGDRDAFFEKYQEVVRMQREAMLREEACRTGRLLPALGLEELSAVLSFLPLGEVGRLMRLNRRTYTAIYQAPLWQDLWAAEVRSGGVPQPSALVDVRKEDSMLRPMRAITTALGGGEDARRCREDGATAGHGHGDYFRLYRQRVWMRRQFTPAALLLVDSGAVMVTPVPIVTRGDKGFRYLSAYRPKFTPMGVLAAPPDSAFGEANLSGPSKSAVLRERHEAFLYNLHAMEELRGFGLARAERFFGDWLYAYPYHMNQPSGERYPTSDRRRELDKDSAKHVVDPVSGAVEWSVLTVAVDDLIETADTPLIVVTHPTWHLGEEKEGQPKGEGDGLLVKCRAAADALFGLCSVPAVGFCHPALCAAIGYVTVCPDATPRDGSHVLKVEMRYGYTLDETKGKPCAEPSPSDVMRYVYKVDTEAMAVLDVVWQRGGEAVPDGFDADIVLVDCNADEPPLPEWRAPAVMCSEEDLLLKDCPILASAKSHAREGQRVYPLAELLGHGVRAIAACPNVCGCLLYRVPS